MAVIMINRGAFGPGGTPVWYSAPLEPQISRLTDMVTPMGRVLRWCVENLEGNIFFERDPLCVVEQNFGARDSTFILWFSDENAAFAFKMRWK